MKILNISLELNSPHDRYYELVDSANSMNVNIKPIKGKLPIKTSEIIDKINKKF